MVNNKTYNSSISNTNQKKSLSQPEITIRQYNER